MVPTDRVTTHPGEIWLYDFVLPRLATFDIAPRTLELFARGERSVDNRFAEWLALTTHASERFWLNLQKNYDESLKGR